MPASVAVDSRVVSLPTGTVTFFLADVEGSTGMQQNARLDYPATIRRIRALLESAACAEGGETVDAVGDEFLAAFTAARPAADAALAAQRALRDEEWPEEVRVRVRIGLHTGTPSFGDEGYTGIDIVRASRIANAGHGGQILVSAETLEFADGLAAVDLGSHRIQGLEQPERIHQLVADDLPRDFPPLRNSSSTLGSDVTVVLAEDTVLLREGIARLLEEVGFEVVAQSGNAEDLLRHVAMHKPSVAVVDIRMPPTHTDEGLRAAREIRERFPATGVLVLSQYVEADYAMDLLSESAESVGYLLKDRVADVEQFAAAVKRVAEGGSALDPEVVSQLVGRQRRDDPLAELTPREREVLALMAEGRSNQAIADRLFITLRAVEKHVTSIFAKLGLPASTDDHRRVLAVLASLQS
jgi:DNA-binding NarL/FixJ family response regulator/class 3 adenylate cyclase